MNSISKRIDYTLLKPTSTEREIIDLCHEAILNDFHSICINSSYVSLAKQLLERSDIKICTVVGFPLGATSTEAKVFEAKKAVEDGADEIEMVINLGFLKSKNYVSVLKDISDVKIAINKIPLKVILEISELSKNEIIKAAEICIDGRADYIKTSSGFSKGGATLTATKIIKKTVKDRTKIQASGAIEDIETALKYLDSGVHRISMTSIPKTTKSLRKYSKKA
ncbi:deoxyribose-phosphate aldolase [Gaetbulibacter saemankumensis]|uniref:deoxyribose-phosphate aldolase n=1 Tax=Gaetbulibacter saemankumensis TaxID=311208 RepID=UPI0003F80A99|nr:deoxyribose-phosphate aldolase [Gaetbulibacter saemankumensis]